MNRVLLGALIGAGIGLVAAAVIIVPALFATNGIVAADGTVTLEGPGFEGPQPLSIELDVCDSVACASPRPFFGTTESVNGAGDLTAQTETLPTRGDFVRARVFSPSGTLLRQTSAQTWDPGPTQTPIRALVAIVVPAAALAVAGAASTIIVPAALDRPPRQTPGARTAPAVHVPRATPRPVATPMSGALSRGFLQHTTVTAYDAASRLPVRNLRVFRVEDGRPLSVSATQDAGRYVVDHEGADDVELRAPGYATLRARLSGQPLSAEFQSRKEALRVRVVGADSGNSLPGVSVRLVRGTQVIREGRTDEDGEFLLQDVAVQDDDMLETAVGRPGFLEGRARAWQTQAGNVVELPLQFEFRPSEAAEDRLRTAGDRLEREGAAWAPTHPDLVALLRSVTDAVAAPGDDIPSWARGLLASGGNADRLLDAVTWVRERWATELMSLRSDARLRAMLARFSKAGATAAVPPTQQGPWDVWLRADPREAQATVEGWRRDRDALVERASRVARAEAGAWISFWGSLVNEDLATPATSPEMWAMKRLLVEAQLHALRWMLSSPTWLDRLRPLRP